MLKNNKKVFIVFIFVLVLINLICLIYHFNISGTAEERKAAEEAHNRLEETQIKYNEFKQRQEFYNKQY